AGALVGVGPSHNVSLPIDETSSLPFLFLDWSWLGLVPVLLLWFRRAPRRAEAVAVVASVTVLLAGSYLARSVVRHWSGGTGVWDLGIFAHPMWLFAHGGALAAAWADGLPSWGEHGSFVFYLFAPLTRLGADPALALFVAQSLLL